MTRQDEDARFEFINGQNDALSMLSPQSQDPYYLQGWHDTKRRLASGELCWLYEKQQQQPPAATEDWEEF